ncbi:VanW family protein [Demequina sp. NBRC 110054]|uniref:VanW family protein n=1 Tax=Demequina sp. NBRC 110054 TaxID=1570343 RepID=UPI0013564324|nr:VanW family protein [Demequina sp. NBRC 110054]
MSRRRRLDNAQQKGAGQPRRRAVAGSKRRASAASAAETASAAEVEETPQTDDASAESSEEVAQEDDAAAESFEETQPDDAQVEAGEGAAVESEEAESIDEEASPAVPADEPEPVVDRAVPVSPYLASFTAPSAQDVSPQESSPTEPEVAADRADAFDDEVAPVEESSPEDEAGVVVPALAPEDDGAEPSATDEGAAEDSASDESDAADASDDAATEPDAAADLQPEPEPDEDSATEFQPEPETEPEQDSATEFQPEPEPEPVPMVERQSLLRQELAEEADDADDDSAAPAAGAAAGAAALGVAAGASDQTDFLPDVEPDVGEEAVTETAPATAPELDYPTEVLPAQVDEPEEEGEPAQVDEPAAETTLATQSNYVGLTDPDQEPLPEFLTREPEPEHRRRWPRVVAIVILVLGLLYVIAEAAIADRVPNGTSVLGVEIGGMTSEDAAAALAPAVEEIDATAVSFTVGTASYLTFPEKLGLSIDVEQTVADHTGFSLDPKRLWDYVAGVGEVDPVITTDDDAFKQETATVASVLDRDALDARVTIVDGVAETVGGADQIAVTTEDVRDTVSEEWPATRIEVPATLTEPDLSLADAEAYAESLNSGPLSTDATLTWDGDDIVVPAEEIAAEASVEIVDGEYALEVDGETIAVALLEDHPELVTEPVDASVTFNANHKIVIDEGAPGLTVDSEALGASLVEAVTAAGGTAELPMRATEAEYTTETLGSDDFKKIVSSFETPLTNEYIRTQNLITAAADVEGTIILPGEQFDLHEILSPITEEEGYGYAHVIVNGVLTDGIGGGLSQMATTTYNAAYFAGYDIDRFRPHTVWFQRYPAGRESTIYGTQINVEFTNDTPYAAVFNSYVEDGYVHVDVWSTPYYTVETQASDKTNIVQPGVDKISSANCAAKSAGQPGFTITNYRQVFLDGEQVKDESFTWTYNPDDAVKCVSASDDE